MSKLKAACERAKRDLSNAQTAKVELSVVAKRPRDAPPLPPDGPLAAPGAAAEAVVEPGTRPVALLTYWDGQGNAEIIRLMMAVSVRLFRCLICWSPA